ncbi:ligase-associated DNA damage response endonuclease PdeM [Pararhizobium haloflavum]|uniref:ligase-associated DNA damage response endonuclease PdeM n=1 Tax=Pararhizobium haloflavum TaxID=2037914 RepID=UPI0018E418E4|nr:ligase-associated DNA damage response endonuclease PdeM [Pararhizobium haloflavum]
MPGRTVAIDVAGIPLVCDTLGVAFLERSRTLIVSDLHLEKGAAFARRGMMLPPYDTAATLDLLDAALRRYRPTAVVSLGDSFHDRLGAHHLPPIYETRLRGLMAGRDWFWIAGNHDPDRPANLPGDCVETLAIDGLTFRHEPTATTRHAAGEIAGHLHPSARVVRRGRAVRRPCFATDGTRLVMPAFGVTTGGLDLRHRAMEGLFDRSVLYAHMLGRERIYSVRFANLSG